MICGSNASPAPASGRPVTEHHQVGSDTGRVLRLTNIKVPTRADKRVIADGQRLTVIHIAIGAALKVISPE